MTVTLIPASVKLAELERIWRDQVAVKLDPSARDDVEAAHAMVRKAADARPIVMDPATRKYFVTVSEPDMHEPRGDLERLSSTNNGKALAEAAIDLDRLP